MLYLFDIFLLPDSVFLALQDGQSEIILRKKKLIATFLPSHSSFAASLIFTRRVNNFFEQVFRLIISRLKACNELCVHANVFLECLCIFRGIVSLYNGKWRFYSHKGCSPK